MIAVYTFSFLLMYWAQSLGQSVASLFVGDLADPSGFIDYHSPRQESMDKQRRGVFRASIVACIGSSAIGVVLI